MAKLPDQYDFSNGSTNTYLVEERHRLIPKCYHCGEFRPVLFDGNDYYQHFMMGKSIGQAMPYLTLDQREILISGTHPECWKEMFKEEEEEGDLN